MGQIEFGKRTIQLFSMLERTLLFFYEHSHSTVLVKLQVTAINKSVKVIPKNISPSLEPMNGGGEGGGYVSVISRKAEF